MEQLLTLLNDYGIITLVIAGVGTLLAIGLKALRAKVASSETKIDDQILKAIDDAIAKSKPPKEED